ncbi:MAG: hypothetical protein ACE5JG_01190 [Planctomycetota bacterium]
MKAGTEDGARAGRRAARGDRALLMGLAGLLAVAASLTPIGSYDYWWHLATGRLILQGGTVPEADPFSFTSGGAAWVDHEWLFQVAAYLVHDLGGAGALVAIKVALVLLLASLMAAHLRREGHGPAGASTVLLVALLGASFRLEVRPELATLVLLPLILHLVIRARDTGRAGPLLAVPPLCALGSNLHVGIVLAPVLLGLAVPVTLVLERLEIRRASAPPAGRPRFTPRLAATCAAAALSTALNPYGLRIWAVPFEVSSVLAGLPWPNLEWAPPRFADFPLFYVCLAAAALVAAANPRRIDPVGTPALLFVGLLAAMHLRNIGLFFVLLPYGLGRALRAPVAAVQRTGLYAAASLSGRVRPGFISAAVLLVAGIPLLVLLPPGISWGVGIAPSNEPAAAVDFLVRERVGERLFNDVRFGGYLIWRRWPQTPVFIDGRNEVHDDLLRDIARSLRDAASWEEFLHRYDIDSAFLRYPGTLQKVLYPAREGAPAVASERAFSAAYFHQDRWALVYWDDDAMIFLRRGERYAEVIERLEYRAIHPDDWRHLWAGVATGRIPAGPILAELKRKLAEDPSCARARGLLRTFSPLGREGPADAAGPGGPAR